MNTRIFKYIYDSHKISAERRKFTRRVIDSLKNSKEKRIKEGNVYCIRYKDSSKPTDDWHQLSLFFVTEVRKTEIAGYNLLYLGREVTYNLLHHNLMYRITEKKKDEEIEYILGEYRNTATQQRVNNELTVTPWSHAFKVFNAQKIVSFSTVLLEDWPFVPLVELSLFGDLNPYFLMRAWDKENAVIEKKHKEKKKQPLLETEEYVFDETEDEFGMEKIDTSTVLSDIKDDILDDDGDDI